MSAAELRRRVRAQERERTAVKLAAADTIRRARSRTAKLRTDLAEAVTAETEAMAAALAVYGSAGDLAEVTGIPTDEIERGAKNARAGRASTGVDKAARRAPR